MSNQQATMICMDCSEYMRNGDYSPNRFEAQREAVQLIMGTKINANPENVVGIMTAGGKRPEVLATLTSDSAKLLTVIHRAHDKILGNSNVIAAIELARLALKHREKKPQRPRMVLFVGSPIATENARKLARLGAQLRKENVAVDVVSFGDYPENQELLEKFVNAANSSDNSSFIIAKPGQNIKDAVRSSPAIGESAGAGGIGGFGEEEDPDILLAIQRSLEEQREREGGDEGATEPMTDGGDDEEAKALEEAMALSKEAAGGGSVPTKSFDEMTEEEQMALAMQMSIDEASGPSQEKSETTTTKEEEKEEKEEKEEEKTEVKSETEATTTGEEGYDRDQINSVLQSLPGVDITDPAIQGILSSYSGTKKEESGDTEMKEENDDEDEEDLEDALKLSMGESDDK